MTCTSGQSSPRKKWKTRPKSEYQYNESYVDENHWRYEGKEKGANYTKDESTQLWMIPESDPFKVPSVTEEDFEKGPELQGVSKKTEFSGKQPWQIQLLWVGNTVGFFYKS